MNTSGLSVLLSFDAEEFDLPRERGVELSLEEAMRVSVQGISVILDILEANGVQATFFCTTNFASHAHASVRRMLAACHEIASHGCDHWHPVPSDAAVSKKKLEDFIGRFHRNEHLGLPPATHGSRLFKRTCHARLSL